MDIENKIMSIGWENDAAKLANKVAMHMGMRAGEIQGLRVKDIQDDGIHVNHSWSRYVGIKSCKNGEAREIPIPISKSLKEELLNYAKFNPWDNGPEAFIFFAQKPGMPMNEKGWGKYLRRALREIGYEKPDEICLNLHFLCLLY
ncbi:MAG: site-specific integrase [Treponema sp.]|nr:site-specific integrase [Treponema sp.]